MAERGIKGSLFQQVVSEAQRLVAEGRIGEAELTRSLSPEDRSLMDGPILPGSWYPIVAHDRLLRLLAAKLAGGSREYWIEGGREAADQLAALGIYHQMDRQGGDLEDFIGRVLVTLSGALYSFTRWRWCGTDESHSHFSIEVSDAADFPDTCRYRAEGFIERAASRATRRDWTVSSRRLPPDRILFEAELKE
jgi:hypothetical protein